MGRPIRIDHYGYTYRIAVDGARSHHGLVPDMAQEDDWTLRFARYRENRQGQLLYLDQPLCRHPNILAEDIQWMRDHPRLHLTEVYDQAELRTEYPAAEYTLIKTLHNVTLLEALEALLAIYKRKF